MVGLPIAWKTPVREEKPLPVFCATGSTKRTGPIVFMDIYNRYAHVFIEFTTGETFFVEGLKDTFELHLSMENLAMLDVKYICLNMNRGDESELPAMEWDGGYAEKIYDEYGIVIYKVLYY